MRWMSTCLAGTEGAGVTTNLLDVSTAEGVASGEPGLPCSTTRESAPGPQDMPYLFDRFIDLNGGGAENHA